MSVASPTEPLKTITMNKTNIIGAIAILGVLIGACAFFRPSVTTSNLSFGAISNTNAPAANSVLSNGTLLPNPSVLDYFVARTYLYLDKALGLGNTTSVPTNIQVVRGTLNTATTTPCALQNPLAATSTILNFSVNVTTATSSAGIFAVGTSTTPYATSSSMTASKTFAASVLGTYIWDGGNDNSLIGPSQYVVFGTAANPGVTYGYTYGGTCQLVVQSVN